MSGVAVGYAVARGGVPAARSFRRWVAAALAATGTDPAVELAIRIVDAQEGQALNLQYRSRDYATNVLSFPAMRFPGQPLQQLGDLLICAPVVSREAAEQGKPVAAHYAHLTVHGVLHLLGHDHEDAATAEQMEALEIAILATLGLPNPYLID